MGGKGDWPRKVDPQKFGKHYENAFGKKCRLSHAHDKTCQDDTNQQEIDKRTK